MSGRSGEGTAGNVESYLFFKLFSDVSFLVCPLHGLTMKITLDHMDMAQHSENRAKIEI